MRVVVSSGRHIARHRSKQGAERLLVARTRGKGLAKWATNAHPYTALVAALIAAGVPSKYVNGLAASYFKRVFGIAPSQRKRD